MSIVASQLIGLIRIDNAEVSMAKLEAVGKATDSVGLKFAGLAAGGALVIGGALTALVAKTTLMAGDFQVQMLKLYTTAGESFKNLTMIGSGILDMAPQVATSVKALGDAMYWIESSGLHGAAALAALRIAAEAAKAENANLTDVSRALGASLNAYAGYGLTDAQVMNILTAATGQGMMTFQQLATSLANVLPASAKFHISLTDVTAAMATMTAQGDPAAQAATHLKQMILALEAPSKIGAAALASVGLSSQQLATEMTRSLPGALQMIIDAVGKKFPEGSAAYNQAIKNIAGGNKQMMGFLELTGTHLQTFNDNVAKIAGTVKTAGNAILGWGDIQKNFNFTLDSARASLEAFGIKIGLVIMPYVQKFIAFLVSNGMPVLTRLSDWVIKIALPALLKFSDWFITKAIPYIQSLAKTVEQNLLPPLMALAQNVIGVSVAIGSWAVQSGFLSNAIGMVSAVLGTLVSWISDFIAGLRDGNPLVSALVGLLAAVGTEMGLIKLNEFASGLFASFNQLRSGAGLLANLATQAFPALAASFGTAQTAVKDLGNVSQMTFIELGDVLKGTGTAVQGVGSAAVGAEGAVKGAAVGMSAAMGIASLGFSLAAGVLVTAFMMAKDKITTGAQTMTATVQADYNSLGNSAADNAAKSQAVMAVSQQNIASEANVSAGKSRGYWVSAAYQMQQASAQAAGKMIIDQQKVADAAQAAAARADAAWVQASQQMSLTALLAASGFTGPQIAAYTGQGYNQFQAGPAPGGGRGFQHGGPVLSTGLAMLHAGEYVLNAAMVKALSPLSALSSLQISGVSPGISAGFGGGRAPVINVYIQQPDTVIDGYKLAGRLMPHIVGQVRNNLYHTTF